MEMKFQHEIIKAQAFQGSQWQYTLSELEPIKKMASYHIVPITPKDSDKMLDFLRQFFFRDEPLNVAVDLVQNENERCYELEEYCVESIGDGMSLMAVSTAGDLIGVCVNGVHEAGHQAEMDAGAAACPNPKFRKILTLLANVERGADLFQRHPDVPKCCEVRILSVDGAWRGKGVGTALIDKTKELAKQHSLPMVRVDCTSHYSALAVARLGFECVFTMAYADYRADGENEPVFTPAKPHSHVSTYILRV